MFETSEDLWKFAESVPAHLPRHETPPTHKSVLLERWAKDTEAMANATIDIYCNDEDGWFEFPDGFSTGDSDTAFSHYIAYLNSAAEGETK